MGLEKGAKTGRDKPRQTKTGHGKARFLWIVEAKLGLEKGAKTGPDRPRQAKTGQDRREERGEKREERGERKEKETEGTFCGERGEGFASLLGGYLPGALDPWFRHALLHLVATFWPP